MKVIKRIALFLARRGRNRIHQGLWVLLEVVDHQLPLFVFINVLVCQKVELAIIDASDRLRQRGRAHH